MTFLVMINFYWHFIRGAAGLLRPLTDALHGNSKQHVLTWSEEMVLAFHTSHNCVANMAMLAHPQ